MREKGIEPPPRISFKDGVDKWKGWFQKLATAFPKTQTFSVTIDPSSVPANSTAEQTATVNGLSTNDIVFINKPSHTSGLIIGNVRVSAANTLAITFANITGSPIDAGSENYNVVAIRY